MKVVIEKNEANIVKFKKDKQYIVLKNFIQSQVLGVAAVSVENGIMYATLKLKNNIKGYPAIGYIKDNRTGLINLQTIGICDFRNEDENIELIEYKN